MKYSYLKIVIVLSLSVCSSLLADPAIVMQLQLPRLVGLPLQQMNIGNKIDSFSHKSPQGASRKLLKNNVARLGLRRDGFLGLYAGYLDFSNREGLITFPLRHIPATKLYLVITPDIELNRISGQTISHAALPTVKPTVAAYVFEKQKDANDTWFWSIRETSDAVHDGRISPLAIVLLSKPHSVFVGTGDYMAVESGNVVLPEAIYVVGNHDKEKTLINAISRLNYFEPIGWLKHEPKEKLKQKIISNS